MVSISLVWQSKDLNFEFTKNATIYCGVFCWIYFSFYDSKTNDVMVSEPIIALSLNHCKLSFSDFTPKV